MFHNRISRFLVNDHSDAGNSGNSAGAFAAIPAFAAGGFPGGNYAAASADIYHLAKQQAQQQVAARRERASRSHEWN